MHAGDVIWCYPPQLRADRRTEVAALSAVTLIAQPAHQFGPRPGDPIGGPAAIDRRSRESESWQRGNHHVECVGGVAAVCARIGERFDQIEKSNDGVWPAVSQDEREGTGLE